MLSSFFCSARHFSAMLNPFLLCQAFSPVLSTSWLCQEFLGYICQAVFRSAKHFSSILNIYLPCQAFSSILSGFFFCCVKHFSAMLSPFRLCQAFIFIPCSTRQSRKYMTKQKKSSAWKKNSWKTRKVLSIAEKCLAEHKNGLA